jgi:hypothetical protein
MTAIETIFTFESTRKRQQATPLLKEREQFLSFMREQGTTSLRLGKRLSISSTRDRDANAGIFLFL